MINGAGNMDAIETIDWNRALYLIDWLSSHSLDNEFGKDLFYLGVCAIGLLFVLVAICMYIEDAICASLKDDEEPEFLHIEFMFGAVFIVIMIVIGVYLFTGSTYENYYNELTELYNKWGW